MYKVCFKCSKRKPLSSFYKHKQMGDGHLNKCKACTKNDVRKRYYDPEGYKAIQAYETERSKVPQRKVEVNERNKNYKIKYPGRTKANYKVNNAIKLGRLRRMPCQECGLEKSEAHHPDYRKPLSVIWLCRQHHKYLHRKYNKALA